MGLLCSAAACIPGGGDDGDPYENIPSSMDPVVAQVTPAVGAVGDTITVIGVGYSLVPQENIVIIGGGAVAATAYGLVPAPSGDEVEQLTATVPDGAALGLNSVVVLVNENTSNADITFTVIP